MTSVHQSVSDDHLCIFWEHILDFNMTYQVPTHISDLFLKWTSIIIKPSKNTLEGRDQQTQYIDIRHKEKNDRKLNRCAQKNVRAFFWSIYYRRKLIFKSIAEKPEIGYKLGGLIPKWFRVGSLYPCEFAGIGKEMPWVTKYNTIFLLIFDTCLYQCHFYMKYGHCVSVKQPLGFSAILY